MDDHRSDDALTDAALERDLEAVLAVDPSPEFVARVRTRVQCEPDTSLSPWQWGVTAAGAIVVVAALVVGMSGPSRSPMARDASPLLPKSSVPVAQPPAQGFGERRRSSPDESASAGADSGPVSVAQDSSLPVAQDPSTARPEPVEGRALRAGFSPAPKRATPTRRRARNEPGILIAVDEARALRRLLANVGKGLVDLPSLQEEVSATAALQPPSGITFQPITFEPIAVETAEEGERQ